MLLLVRSGDYIADVGVRPTILGIVFLLEATAGFSWLNWRCPAFHEPLGANPSPDRCRHCGVELMDQ